MEAKIENSTMFNISYGLFLLSVKDNDFDNGCIINTVMQITDNSKKIAIAISKDNYSHDMLIKSGVFNLSILSEDADFDFFRRFGFASGRDTNKFQDFNAVKRSENGLYYATDCTNSFISAKVITAIDCGSHSLIIAEVTEAANLSDKPSMTYKYYFDFVKPKPQPQKKKGYICKICNYVYEGENLPEDFICPICKHGVADFEPII